MAKSPKQNTSKYEIAKEWTAGFIAGLSPASINQKDSPTYQAGYEVGYRMRFMKHALLNEYLRSIGVEQMGYVVLAENKIPAPEKICPICKKPVDQMAGPFVGMGGADIAHYECYYPGSLPPKWVAEKRTDPVAEVENKFSLPEGALHGYPKCQHCRMPLGNLSAAQQRTHIANCPLNPKAPL